jgi:sugar phosphate isomerase/epimerase
MTTAACAGAASSRLLAKTSQLKLGVTDWNLGKGANPESVGLAAECGFRGVEVSLGTKVVDNRLPVDNPAMIQRYKEEFKKHKIEIAGTCVDMLHRNCLMDPKDKLAQKWVSDAIRVSKELNSKVLLLPFFGKCELKTQANYDGVAEALKDLVKEAERAGVTLGFENTISVADNLRIIDKVGSRNLKIYLDPCNLANFNHDPYKETKLATSDRVCQIHIKDNPHYLGEGKLRWNDLMKDIMAMGFVGWANLETDSPSKNIVQDMKRNLSYVQQLVGVRNVG